MESIQEEHETRPEYIERIRAEAIKLGMMNEAAQRSTIDELRDECARIRAERDAKHNDDNSDYDGYDNRNPGAQPEYAMDEMPYTAEPFAKRRRRIPMEDIDECVLPPLDYSADELQQPVGFDGTKGYSVGGGIGDGQTIGDETGVDSDSDGDTVVLDDDSRTVVDLSFVKRSRSPAHERYLRFKQLVRLRDMEQSAYRVNCDVLVEVAPNLDNAEIVLLHQSLERCSKHTDLIDAEILEIYDVISAILQEKSDTYAQIQELWVHDRETVEKLRRGVERIHTWAEEMYSYLVHMGLSK